MDLPVMPVRGSTRCWSLVAVAPFLFLWELESCLQNHPSVPSGDTITGLSQYGQHLNTDY